MTRSISTTQLRGLMTAWQHAACADSSEDAIAVRVMGDLAKALVLIERHSDDMKDQGFLRLSAHHAVQG
jgi:hypothetical protein